MSDIPLQTDRHTQNSIPIFSEEKNLGLTISINVTYDHFNTFFFLTRRHLSGSAVFKPRSGPGDNQSLFLLKKGGLKFTSGKLWWSLHHVVKLFALCTTCRVMWLVQLVSLLPDFTFMTPGNGLLWLLIYKTRLSLDWSIVISLPLWCRHLHWERSEIFMSCYDLKWKWLFIYTYFCTMKCHTSRKHCSLQLQGWYDRKKRGKLWL